MIDWVVALQQSSEPPLASREGRLRILLVVPRLLISRGLSAVLSEVPEFEVCGEVGGVEGAVEMAVSLRPDLALVSLDGEPEAVALVRQLLAVHPLLRVLILARGEQPFYAEGALRSGARGYVANDVTPEELVDALRRIVAGEVILGATIIERLLLSLSQHRTRPLSAFGANLSARESQVLELIGRGLTRQEMAESLELSAKTVDVYRSRLKTKLNMSSPGELYRFAQHNGGKQQGI